MRKIINNIRDIKYLREMKKIKNEEKIIYLLTPRYGNLGDQMIAIACKNILSDYYPNKKIVEIEDTIWKKHKKKVDEIINSKDLIVVPGGGNLGDIWPGAEFDRKDVFEKYPNNKIIIMPQTITFESEEGKESSRKIYSKVKDLTIITREETSYARGKEIFEKNKICLVPDSVLYLEDKYIENNFKRNEEVLFLLRKDQEKVVSSNFFKNLLEVLKNKKINYKLDDTVIKSKGKLTKDTREDICLELINKIKKSKVVVTDRLHGMIFAVITNTPVLVFASSTVKTKGTLKWLEHLNYVSYIDEKENLENVTKELERLMKLEVKKNGYEIKKKMKEIFKEIFK